MPIIHSGPGGYVSISTPRLFEKIRGINKIVRQGAIKGAMDVARLYRDTVRDGLRSGNLGLRPLSPDTIRTRLEGKPVGKTPAKPVHRRQQPLYYTGSTARTIAVRIRSEAVFEVSVSPNASIDYSGGKMAKVAGWQEKGFRRRGRFTRESLAFLHILFRRHASRGARAREDSARRSTSNGARVGMSYSSKVPPRPAWANASRRIRPRIASIIARRVREQFRKEGLRLDVR